MELDGGEWPYCIHSAASAVSYSLTFSPQKTAQSAQAVQAMVFSASASPMSLLTGHTWLEIDLFKDGACFHFLFFSSF
jgi:hypothetical protein